MGEGFGSSRGCNRSDRRLNAVIGKGICVCFGGEVGSFKGKIKVEINPYNFL